MLNGSKFCPKEFLNFQKVTGEPLGKVVGQKYVLNQMSRDVKANFPINSPTDRPPPRKEVVSSDKGEGSLRWVGFPRPAGMSHPILFTLMTLVHILYFTRAAKPTCRFGYLLSATSILQVSSWTISSDGKNNFNSINIPKKDLLGLLLNWAKEVGCSQEYQLIANCLEFIDSPC